MKIPEVFFLELEKPVLKYIEFIFFPGGLVVKTLPSSVGGTGKMGLGGASCLCHHLYNKMHYSAILMRTV